MLERDFFKSKREEFIENSPDMIELEKYGQYCLVPLDIPRFDRPDLVKWFFEASKPSYKVSPDVATDITGYSKFDTVDVMPLNELDQQDVWTLNIRQDFMVDFKDFYEEIMHYLPFKTISRIRLWSSTKPVSFHRDQTKFLDFPGAFRIIIYDENPFQTLSLVDTLPDSREDLSSNFFIPRLKTTNSYAWNNLRTKHGSTFKSGFRKIVIILDRYELDISKYQALLDRSIKKYENCCLTSNRLLKDYI
jgi:hypothetical protein